MSLFTSNFKSPVKETARTPRLCKPRHICSLVSLNQTNITIGSLRCNNLEHVKSTVPFTYHQNNQTSNVSNFVFHTLASETNCLNSANNSK